MLNRLAVLCILLAAAPAVAEPVCKRPVPVDSVSEVQTHFLVVKSIFGPAVVDSECVLLNPDTFAGRVQFSIIPSGADAAETAYVFVKSYRVFTTMPPDKIKMSRGDGWFFPAARPGNYSDEDRIDDVPFDGSVEDWNAAHSSKATPEQMEKRLDFRWHAYPDKDEAMPSTRRIDFWKTRADFDFSHGTLTSYLIRFPANSATPIPFNVGLLPQVKEFQLEFYSNIDQIFGTYRFIRK